MAGKGLYAFVFVAMCLLTSVPSHTRQRHALVIGIGQYEDKAWSRISGDTDVPYVCEMLRDAGFKDIVTLKNELATKAAIVKELKRLATRCNAGDGVYIHFSGHGQQMTDIDGDESDGWDESWVPYDAGLAYGGRDKGEKHLCDDELNALLQAIRDKVGSEGVIVVVVDACHSGDSLRGPDTLTVRGVDTKFEIPRRVGGAIRPNEESWLTISACEDYQVNFELPSPKVGKLTWCLYQLRHDLTLKSDNDIIVSIAKMMESPEMAAPLPQSPRPSGMVGGNEFKLLFGKEGKR